MSDFRLGVAVWPSVASLPPPGVPADRYHASLLADTLDVVDDLDRVEALLVAPSGPAGELARSVAWPGLPVLTASTVGDVLDDLTGRGCTIGAVVAGDAPDLPGLLVGKLLSACEDRAAGVLPAADGGLVGLAAQLPAPRWLIQAHVDLDAPDALARLHAAAPVRSVVVGPGWHRLRAPSDIARLDPALAGWEQTRALLSTPRRP